MRSTETLNWRSGNGKRGHLREREVEGQTQWISYMKGGWVGNICTIFAPSEFSWLEELIALGNTGLAPNLKLTSGSVLASFFYCTISKDIFVLLGSFFFSWVAPACVHALFKIILLGIQ